MTNKSSKFPVQFCVIIMTPNQIHFVTPLIFFF